MKSPIEYRCQHCDELLAQTTDFTGPIATGMLALCSCKASRDAWEAEHRAEMERRKVFRRKSSIRERSIVFSGRTTKRGPR